ncbi:unnamed protein product [Adineta steineri]|uniref:Uncharacterized protein n=1 Tax=Adineta steineri TaxID=433720 RepID=A0A815A5B8_9BILA|nr:unnamed protein product [Adineta steineri]CAF1252513.1 unnamed protein product [Adineta steineri]
MATSRISSNTNLPSNTREQRQAQARIRALQRRTNTLYEDLSRSSVVTQTAVDDYRQVYMTITNEFQEQRIQLLHRLPELDHVHKNLNTVQSHHIPQNLSKQSSSDLEISQMNDMIDDIDRVLNKIAQKLKPFHFISPNDGTTNRKGSKATSLEFQNNQHGSTNELCISRLYSVDVDITPQWAVSTIDKRIFFCDIDGEIRIFSYSRSFHRQPLCTEHFHLTITNFVSSFTATQEYLVAFEAAIQTLTLHTHHGGILLRLSFPYDIIMMARNDYDTKNQIWACSRTKHKCYQFLLEHTIKEVNILDEYDFTQPISNIFIDPIGISTDEQNRVAVHDINSTTMDRLLLFTNQQIMTITLDFVKYLDSLSTSRIEQVLLVPKHENIIVIVYASKISITNLREIIVVDISLRPAQILHRLSEAHGIQAVDVTLNGELVYTVPAQKHRRIPTRMNVYSLFK